MRGKVYLVGAGFGGPEHLTLKALRVLEVAEVVLHDRLVHPGVLALAKGELVPVGKAPPGGHRGGAHRPGPGGGGGGPAQGGGPHGLRAGRGGGLGLEAGGHPL